MKHLKTLAILLGFTMIFAACSNGSEGGGSSDSDPIDRNTVLSTTAEIDLSTDTSYNLSSYSGKKAFLVVMNPYSTNQTVALSGNMMNQIEPGTDYELVRKNTTSKTLEMFVFDAVYGKYSNEAVLLLFKNVFKENPLLAVKCLLWIKGIRNNI